MSKKIIFFLSGAAAFILTGVGCSVHFSTEKGISVSGDNAASPVVTANASVRAGHLQFTLPETWKVTQIKGDNEIDVTTDEAEVQLTIATSTAIDPSRVTRTYPLPDGKIVRTFNGAYMIVKGDTYYIDYAANGSDLHNFDIDLMDFERSVRWIQ
jgi:hypothetical protein